MRVLSLPFLLMFMLIGKPAWALCSSYPYTLTNGTPADATQVMANFNCAALSSGSNMTGASLSSISLTGVTTLQSGNANQLVLNNTIGTPGNNIVFKQNGTNQWVVGQQAGDQSGNLQFYSYNSASVVLSANLTSNNVTCGGSCISASDQRMKRSIVPLSSTNGLAAIKRLVPVSFHWKKGDTSQQIGFIAQEVHNVFPQLVTNSGVKQAETPDGMLAINYGALTAPIVLALKELDNKVSHLEQDRDQRLALKAMASELSNLRQEIEQIKMANQVHSFKTSLANH